MFEEVDWVYLKKLNDLVWVKYSAYGAPVLLFFIVYKFYRPIFWQEIKASSDFPHLLEDKILRPFIFYGPIYYLFDVLIKVLSGTIFEDGCQTSFFFHHLVCVIFLPFGVWSKYVPWFCLLIGFTHAILLWFTSIHNLQYLYAVSLFFYHYGAVQYPFSKQLIQFKLMNLGTWLLYLSLVGLWINRCHHTHFSI